MIRLLLVDDQQLVREGLKSLLEAQPDLAVVAEAENGQVAVDQVSRCQPDVILMDVRMPVMDGIAATQAIHQANPAAKVLILTTFDDQVFIADAIHAGAKGYLLKDTPSNELAEAIRAVQKGYSQMGPGILEKIIQPMPEASAPSPSVFDLLTPREQEVLHLIAAGKSNREIAAELYITERTVKNHVNSILRTLDVRDRTQAAILVQQAALSSE
ncbi:response regulator transcription factor [Lyngbya confervoides]|uniref:Response regulator transcription factor n=1 Tax=Lyngbya confervoides BDU141951 TaxID=1574623 RepID=A0ABD4T301_9CYAN|nr:response regulator transcription factor [Lyngbya confervoides]MCM1982813.1 response regulator transcription factor [Lyngbya confervoides BDU141951]